MLTVDKKLLRRVQRIAENSRSLKGKDPAGWKKTVKSFLLQNIEYQAQQAELELFKSHSTSHGSLEHDGIKELQIRPFE